MITARLTLQSIDYEESFRNLFPFAMDKIQAADSNHMLVRLLKMLNDTALDSALTFIGHLPQMYRDELLCTLFNYYEPAIRENINTYLQNGPTTDGLQLGKIRIFQYQQTICIHFENIAVNPLKLQQSLGVKIGGILPGIPIPNILAEKAFLKLMQTRKGHEKAVQYASELLNRMGILATLDDIEFVHSSAQENPDRIDITELTLSLDLEDALLHALADCLKTLADLQKGECGHDNLPERNG